MAKNIPFIDLESQRQRVGAAIDAAVMAVLKHGKYIMGPEVTALEQELADLSGARHVLACSSGTDALALCLMAKGIRPGDAVFVPGFTFAATAEVVAWMGAVPFFVDVRADTFNMCPDSLRRSIAAATAAGHKPAAVMAVDLFGQPADYAAIEPIAAEAGMWVLSDAAQSFGATTGNRRVGTIGTFTSTSFYPAKPLGCYGDGGAVFTDDSDLYEVLRSLRVHGEGTDKYDNVLIGMNGRMDTIQAAVLLQKLKVFEEELIERNRAAVKYSAELADVVEVPVVSTGNSSSWAQYTLRVADGRRDALISHLRDHGIPTAVHYRRPLHHQPAYRAFPTDPNGLPVAEQLATEVVSLPMHAYLTDEIQDRIIEGVRSFFGAAGYGADLGRAVAV